MTTVTINERTSLPTVLTVARKELGSTISSRWFAMWVLAFVGLATVLVLLALPSSRLAGAAGFGRTGASLITLVQVIVPLMGLSLGAVTMSSQRENGALRFLMSHPINRAEAFWGMYLGNAGALAIAAGAGFGVAGVTTAMRGVSTGTGAFIWVAILSWLLSLAMLGVGTLISVFSTRSGGALGLAVFVWLLLVFIGDLGIMGTAVATDMPVSVLFVTALTNPVEVFRLAALSALSGSLDALGPAGTYAVDTLGGSLEAVLLAVLVMWLVVPVLLARSRFVRKVDL